MKSTKKTKKAPVKKTSATTKKSVNTQKNPVTKKKNKTRNVKENISKKVPIGQTLETKDNYLPKNKNTSKKTRPVIITDKRINDLGKEEYTIIPASKRNTRNTTYYGKNGIKFYRHTLEVRDNENRPIQQGAKFKKTKNSTQIPRKDVEVMMDKLLNHTKQSSANRKKYSEFKNRNKKSKS